ncbi:hypothetical protein COV04_02645 [Candidatus Uhrbacteria bacterium CG10_big_fil_rev_8_21_14_0_10_48_11]|uniref:HTH HARE-type domain-containing protein n=1 Tax=Candidatus Uhrbacteria bacterium CG10_big_fil_rev_8_21_14_0_10_48_11 TaxID=1975037 RepID=A0A2M8LEF2_9BACT|nr:MAG: hypothetical protein COV04_02645 [Candidatus Uhrbacteria bacterium CG10_big_fil_rev_8_21_14_0_10_48_11]
MSEYSILDKLIAQRHAEEIRTFDPVAVVNHLLSTLADREADVVRRRFAIPEGGQTETLEEIGDQLSVTRERIRQIAKSSVDKLRALSAKNEELKLFIRTTEYLLRSYGGALEAVFFIDQLLDYSQGRIGDEKHEASTKACLHFLLDHLLDGFVEYREDDVCLRPIYVLTGVDTALLKGAVESFVEAIKTVGYPIERGDLLQRFRQQPFYLERRQQLVAEPVHIAREFIGSPGTNDPPTTEEENRVLTAYLSAAGELAQNIFGEWGMRSWQTIHPRRMNDKIYLILRHHGKPLHFNVITEKINSMHFDSKVAKAPSVHNELILDKRFVLVGRGLYALREWGYQPGTVVDVVRELLQKEGSMKREQIVRAVLERRMVKKQTIHLALLNSTMFTKDKEGNYHLVQQA